VPPLAAECGCYVHGCDGATDPVQEAAALRLCAQAERGRTVASTTGSPIMAARRRNTRRWSSMFGDDRSVRFSVAVSGALFSNLLFFTLTASSQLPVPDGQ